MGELYPTGTKVTITLEAIVVNDDYLTTSGQLDSSDYLLVRDEGSGYHHAFFNTAVGRGVKVDVKEEPVKNWPPQEDDVWRTKSGSDYHFIGGYFYRKHSYEPRTVRETKENMKMSSGIRLIYRKF